MKKPLYIIIAVLVLVIIFCCCRSDESKMLEVAEDNLKAGLEADLENGYINHYKILKTEPIKATEKELNDPDLVEQCKTANVHIVYELRIGKNTGKTGLIQLERYSHVVEDENGNFAEVPDETIYFDKELFETGEGIDAKIAGLNESIWRNDYQAKIDKAVLHGESEAEIAELLFKDWIESFSDWGNNAFIITEYENCKVSKLYPPEDNLVAGYKKEDLVYPKSLKTMTLNGECDFTCIGKWSGTPSGIEIGGGQAYGNDGLKLCGSDVFAMNPLIAGFVLTEWEDCYTLDTMANTISNCKKNVL